MSALALVLGRLAPGVWRGGTQTSGELVRLAESLGWDVRSGTLDAPDDKTGYLESLGTIAEVPAHVRPNWDAMADGFRDLSFDRRLLLVIDAPSLSAFDGIAVEILDEAVTFWAAHGATLQVVWSGPIQAPGLDDVDPVKRSRTRKP